VVPIPNEGRLRNLAWIEDNRRKVDQMTGGRVAYVYLPDAAGGGLTSFTRYFYAQVDKEAVIVDERFNGGDPTDSRRVGQESSEETHPSAAFKA
jgi:tricorn protease